MADQMSPEMVATDDITVVDELAALAPPLTTLEYQHLSRDIHKNGIREPLVVLGQDERPVLLDGHNRLKIARSMGTEKVPVRRERLTVRVLSFSVAALPPESTPDEPEYWDYLAQRAAKAGERGLFQAAVYAEAAAERRAGKTPLYTIEIKDGEATVRREADLIGKVSPTPEPGSLAMRKGEWKRQALQEAKLFILRTQLQRRNVTPYSKIAMTWKARKDLYRKHAEQERQGRKDGLKVTPLRLDERLADDCAVAKQTAYRAKWLLNNAPKDYIKRLEAGDIAIGTAYTELQKAEEAKVEAAQRPELRAGKQVRSRVPALLKTFKDATPDAIARYIADTRPDDIPTVLADVDKLLEQMTYLRDRLHVEAERAHTKDAA